MSNNMEYDLLLKRFRHLLESDVIREYDEVDEFTGGYKKDIRELDRAFRSKFTEVNLSGRPKPQGESIDNVLTVVVLETLANADKLKTIETDVTERLKQDVFVKDNSITRILFIDRRTGRIMGEI